MDGKIQKDLSREEQSEFHKQMLKDCRALVDQSRTKMGQNYDKWEHSIKVFEGWTNPDQKDQQARERKEPEKMVVPMAYSQVMTFVSFAFALITQRERVFELLGMSTEDHQAAKIGESFLQRDLTKNIFEQKLFQFLLDIARCSVGVIKISWERQTQRIKTTQTAPVLSIFGLNIGSRETETEQTITKYLGNVLTNVSPFRFFPDTRLPLSRFQEGEFCASEDEYSYVQLKQMEADGLVAGIDYVKRFSQADWERRGPSRSSDDLVAIDRNTMPGYSGQSKGTILVTEVQRVIIPSKYEIDGKPLGKEEYPVKYLIWYANDSRVIRCEPLNYLHDEFTYSLAQFTPDQHNLINLSLSDSVDALQSVISWFINSHITSVRKVIQNFMVVDPNGIEMKDLLDRKSVIRLKGTAAGGVDRYIKQLAVQDVTANHLNDVEILERILQQVTGISENLMGQFHPGRRSATEARNVSSGAMSRLKMVTTIVFRSGLEPMARQMLSNLRDGLDEETMVRLVGEGRTVEAGGQFVKADKSDLAGNYDFEVFDGTLPSEKSYTAQALQDVLVGLMANPQAAIALQMNPRAILLEMMELRGIRNPERFSLQAPPQQLLPNANLTGQTNEAGTPPGPESTPGESILQLFGGGGSEQGQANSGVPVPGAQPGA